MECVRNIKIGIEVPLLLSYFALMLSDPVNTNFVIYRACYTLFDYNETDCAKLGEANKDNSTAEMEKTVQPTANKILMSSSLLSQILALIICLFIGPWSDKHGRRPVLLLGIAGQMLGYLVKVAITIMPLVSPWYMLLESIPFILSGGFSTFMMICLCYTTDTSTVERRGVRMAILECMLASGMLLGTFSSTYVFHATGYTTVFLISATTQFFSWIYTYYLVPECVVNTTEIEDNLSIFSLKRIREMVHSLTKRREGYNRTILVCTVWCLAFYILAINNGNAMFLYLRSQFHWSLEQITLFNSASALVFIAGTVIGVYVLHKLLHIPESFMVALGFVLLIAVSLIRAAATKDWHIYAALGVHSLAGAISPMIRSLISKIVGTEEIGKLFALTVVLESFMNMLCAPLYTFLYNATIDSYPAAFNLFQALLYFIELIIITIVIVVMRIQRAVPYNPLVVN